MFPVLFVVFYLGEVFIFYGDDGGMADFFAFGDIAIILSALGDEEVEVHKLGGGGTGFYEGIDDLDEELVKFLAGDGADFKVTETIGEDFGHFFGDGGFGDVEGVVNVK